MSANYSRDDKPPNATYVFQIVELSGQCWDVEGTSLFSLSGYISGPTSHAISKSIVF